MRKFGLIGYPLGHSFSKKYFTEKFLKENIRNCSYENYPLTSLDQLENLISEPDIEGLNVTIPYKSEVIPYLTVISDEASAIGAVNVIKIKRNRDNTELHGFNSDIAGIMDTLRPVLSPDIKKAMVLGTGGSSKAVCYVLKKINVQYTLISRSSRSGHLTYHDVGERIIKEVQLIINTTPLGMYPDTGRRPELRYDFLDENHILFDLVYNPEMTLFLRTGKEMGCKILTGLKMLHSQAERAWEIWNNDSF